MQDGTSQIGGTGSKLGDAAVIFAGVASLAASILSIISICFQIKNYRKPLLQRYVVRILLMVPIYAASSWASIRSTKAAAVIEPIRDIYEAFTIYTFFQLLINFLGGERAVIIMTHGRAPVNHLWPLNHCFSRVDISDPHTFLAIKRGILQYAWIKPVLSIATIIMRATDTFQEGYVGLESGYFWSGLIYNISVTISLYSLGMFWVCMSKDLQPFRPVPKFLCIKLIIFASYWQGFFLSILVWLGAIPDDVKGYTPDNIAAAIQDALICVEMPIFAVAHWYAFSWHDYADLTISAARLPVLYALRDAFGPRDLIEDTRLTFFGKDYGYRYFDSGDTILAHAESDSRVARMMEGLRYERGGRGKYWIPQPGKPTSKTPLLGDSGSFSSENQSSPSRYNAIDEVEDVQKDDDDERLFVSARALEFGDWNYPVITAHEASRERWVSHEPHMITPSTNRNVFQPTNANRARREHNIQKTIDKGKRKSSSQSEGSSHARAPILEGMLNKQSSKDSPKEEEEDRDQLVDLVVEDGDAEDAERVRARKEGGPNWNEVEPRRFVRVYPDSEQGEEIREGFEPSNVASPEDAVHPPSHPNESDPPKDSAAEERNDDDGEARDYPYGDFDDERSAWDRGGDER